MIGRVGETADPVNPGKIPRRALRSRLMRRRMVRTARPGKIRRRALREDDVAGGRRSAAARRVIHHRVIAPVPRMGVNSPVEEADGPSRLK